MKIMNKSDGKNVFPLQNLNFQYMSRMFIYAKATYDRKQGRLW